MKHLQTFSLLAFFIPLLFPIHTRATDFVFENDQFSFQALRTAGYTFSGGADIAECLSTCSRITDGDVESWYSEWLSTAIRLNLMADSFLEEGSRESARECYFRASGYFRAAEFFLRTNPPAPQAIETWEKSRDAFLSGASLSNHPIIPVEIPFEDGYLPGYLCLADNTGAIRPMILAHSGFDGTKEELYFSLGSFAVERGYNCLLFEGPGQGEVIRERNIPFRPDWESVVSPVVDFVIELPFVDTNRIVLIGYSMGGYLAPRAVAYEHRIAACVANGGTYSMYANAVRSNPPNIDEILDDAEASQEYDRTIYEAMEGNLFINWFYSNGMWTFGVDSPSDFMRSMRQYTLSGCVKNITCDMLILDSQNDALVGNQAIVLFDSLQCPKEYILFTEEEGADEHCQMGAVLVSNERIFSWLHRVLDQNGVR